MPRPWNRNARASALRRAPPHAGHVVAVLVEYQYAAVGCFHYLGKFLQLLVVHLVDVALVVIDGSVGELAQLGHQSGGAVGYHVARLSGMGFAELQHAVALEASVGFGGGGA